MGTVNSTAKIQFEHRQPPQDWTESPSEIETWLRSPVEEARCLAQQIHEKCANTSLRDAPNEKDVEALIHMCNIVCNNLGDISAMLDHLEVAS